VGNLKIGFALLSSAQSPVASTRIACLNLLPHLATLGAEPVVIFDQAEPVREPDMTGVAERAAGSRCDVVVFQKVHGASVLKCVTRLRELGIASVYYVCDFVDDAMAAAVDRTATVTEFLRSLYAPELHSSIDVVHDGIERPGPQKLASEHRERRALRAALVTSQELYALPVIGIPPSPWHVDVLGRYPRAATQRLRSLRWSLMREPSLRADTAIIAGALHRRIRHTPWSIDGVYEALLRADIGIIPIDTSDTFIHPEATVPAWQLKSENRLTLKMAIGLPVIATPIPSYESVIEHGRNGFLARSREDWTRCFNTLRDPALRIEMGARARLSVLERYSVEAQAQKLMYCIRRALVANAARNLSQGTPRSEQAP
jgi:glycosyl transferase family 1